MKNLLSPVVEKNNESRYVYEFDEFMKEILEEGERTLAEMKNTLFQKKGKKA